MRRALLGSLTAGLLIAALVPAAVSASTPVSTVSFVSDSTWTAYSDAGLSASLGSAEEVCLNSTNPTTGAYAGGCPAGAANFNAPYNGAWAADLSASPTAYWIWAPGVTAATAVTTDPTVYFSKTFDLTTSVEDASIWVAADNDAQVFVNGFPVGTVGDVSTPGSDSSSYNQTHAFTIPAADFLPGSNTITVLGVNAPLSGATTYQTNPAGVVFGGTIDLGYQPAGTTCLGDPGHQILPPIASDGTSIFKQGSTVPAKFRVCDALGNSIGTPGVVSSFTLLSAVQIGGSGTINETIVSTTPDTVFRWDSTGQQWIFNISTKNLMAGYEYSYAITLNDGSVIDFSFGLK
jgi:hypothetical protein